MNKSFKASAETIEKIIEYYADYKTDFDEQKFFFKAKKDSFSILVYKNYTVFFQGNNFEDEMKKWDNSLEDSLFPEESINEEVFLDNEDAIGSDEVGCGDYLAPIVVCCAYVKESKHQFLKEIGVKDSKQLSDVQIRKIAPLIKENTTYAYFVLSNQKYNELVEKKYNLNKIKAYLHNFVITKLIAKTNFANKIVIDQFCSVDNYYNYLADYDGIIARNILFTEKAENKCLAVACASIIARDIFLEEVRKIEFETGYEIILGAGSQVDELGIQILNEKGVDFLKRYSKFNYKNTNKILGH